LLATLDTATPAAYLHIMKNATTRLPRTLARVQADPRVRAAYKDEDGWWIDLKPGWTADPLSAHDIHADTLREAIEYMGGIEPCACKECAA
jgi:hypothetical protein